VNNCFRSLQPFFGKYLYWCSATEEEDELKCEFYVRGLFFNRLSCVHREGGYCRSIDVHLEEDVRKKIEEL